MDEHYQGLTVKETYSAEVFCALEGGSTAPTLSAILLLDMNGAGVGVRLMKARVKEVFLWDRLYIAGGSSSAFSPVEVTNVLSDTNGPGVGIRLVRRGA